MDAHGSWARPAARLLAALVVSAAVAPGALAAGYRTTNFIVDAPTPQLAKEVGDAAEHWRRSLAIEWLGEELPRWSSPCPIKAVISPNLGAGGATSFVFDRGEVFDWKMEIQGSRQRILDSVLPHEITHTIFASHFRQPIPRWADEGACTTVEHDSEIAKQERMLIDFLKTRRGIPFSDMFVMKDYPADVLPLYAQGHSLAKYLIGQRGKQAFLNFLADGMQDENWPRAIREHYQYDHLLALQNSWMDWIRQGRPALQPAGGAMLASAQTPATPAASVATGPARAAMSPQAHEPQARPAAAAPTRSAVVQASASIPTPAPAGGAAAPPAARSVYGEKATWVPARQPLPPANTSASAPANPSGVTYDAARPRATVMR